MFGEQADEGAAECAGQSSRVASRIRVWACSNIKNPHPKCHGTPQRPLHSPVNTSVCGMVWISLL